MDVNNSLLIYSFIFTGKMIHPRKSPRTLTLGPFENPSEQTLCLLVIPVVYR